MEIYYKSKKVFKRLIILSLINIFITPAKPSAPEINNVVSNNILKYIEENYKRAIRMQKKHRIPASIILAQALLESAAGQSYLALGANNHFGLKCTEWEGLNLNKNDNGTNACFRKYLDISDSFEDYSRFLTDRVRYKPLFKLRITDYKSWALGLKKYGYASDPHYASKLIKIIEKYKLYYYDTAKETYTPQNRKDVNSTSNDTKNSKPVKAGSTIQKASTIKK